jgi:hypothetical protein
VYIHNIKDSDGHTDWPGSNPFGLQLIDGKLVSLGATPTYDWVNGNGYANFAIWVETAAKKAGR